MNIQTNGISHTTKGNVRKIRPIGQIQYELKLIFEKNPNASIEDVMKILKISKAYASKLIRKTRTIPIVKKGSAVDKIISAFDENQASVIQPKNKDLEKKFIALISLFGIERLEEIIKVEKNHINKILKE